MKIEIKSNIYGKTIFEFEKENNTIKDVVEEAVKRGIKLCYANLSFAKLHEINLCGENLRYANLSGADLSRAKLYGADLRGADLRGADLYGAELSGAELYGATLRYADLRYANLSGADLSCAKLHGADLRGAKLYGANLYNAELSGAKLYGADLHSAKLYGADLSCAKNIPFIPLSCPSDGSFIGWKKISRYKENYEGKFLVKLLIPEDAKRCSAATEKCRCDKAKVLEITNIETNESVSTITNINDTPCVYKVGEMVYPDSFDEDRWNECSHGIHFFANKQSAMDYNI